MALTEKLKLKAALPKRLSRRTMPSANQFDFFEALDKPSGAPAQLIRPDPVKLNASEEPVTITRSSPEHIACAPRRITEDDVPAYDLEEVALVDASLSELPSRQQWFTYSDIQRSFGVSRATIARKVKAGLVPGILFDSGRVVEEGAVRRFSRNQVRFVLLAVRRRDWKSAAF